MKIQITNRFARLMSADQLTSGSVGLTATLAFSDHWDGLNKVATFSGSGTSRDVVVPSTGIVTVPAECVASHGGDLTIGVYGYTVDDGSIVVAIPTVMCCLGKIEEGSDPSGVPSSEVTPTVAEQVIAIAQSVRDDADSGAFDGSDGEDGVSCTHQWSGSVLSVTSASGTSSADLKGPRGNDGNDGEDGSDGVSATHRWIGTTLEITSASGTSSADLKGPQGNDGEAGYTPVRGTDYWTASDKSTIVSDTVTALQPTLATKVDKVAGKGLSTNDYDSESKTKVDSIPENPKYTDTVYDDSVVVGRISAIEGKESGWDAKVDTDDIPSLIEPLTYGRDEMDSALSGKQDVLTDSDKQEIANINMVIYDYDDVTGLSVIKEDLDAGKKVVIAYTDSGTTYYFSLVRYYNTDGWQDCEFIVHTSSDGHDMSRHIYLGSDGNKSMWSTPVVTNDVVSSITDDTSNTAIPNVQAIKAYLDSIDGDGVSY